MSFAACETDVDETYSVTVESPIKKECSFISHEEIGLNLLIFAKMSWRLKARSD